MKRLDRQDITDILYGCAILGTGGGGELSEGFDYIEMAMALGKTFNLVSLADLDDEQMLCTPYMLGALSFEDDKAYASLPKSSVPPILLAYQRLQQYSARNFDGTICCELGGENTAISFYLAAMMDGIIVDGDPAGRAVPEITHSTYYLNELPAAPIVTANQFGECFVCENIADDRRAEDVVRALAMVSNNDIAAIDHALPVSQLRGAIIEGTISKALAIGQAYRGALENNGDIAQAIAAEGKGLVRFRGLVTAYDFDTEDGFTVGQVSIQGQGDFAGDVYTLHVKNENLMASLNGEVDVTIPDLICCLDMDENLPVTNPNYQVGMAVAIVILPAPEAFKTEKGLAAFGPEYLGLTQPYKPGV